MKLLNIDQNAKTVKGRARGYMTGILYLKPNKKLCPNASKECFSACLNMAGRGRMRNVQEARKRKVDFLNSNPSGFFDALITEIEALQRRALKSGFSPTVRLNGTSDLDFVDFFEHNIFKEFEDIQFYDYTKDLDKLMNNKINNYHLTFSWSGSNKEECIKALTRGFNVAVVFSSEKPTSFLGYKTIDGDQNDLRFLDLSPRIVALKVKGTKNINEFIRG